MTESIDDFGDRLDREFMAGRALQIHDELWKTFSDLGQKRTHRRLQEIVSAQPGLSTGLPPGQQELAQGLIAHAQAIAENALIAVAVYLARHEGRASSEDAVS